MHDEFENDIDECTTDSDFMSGPEGKTPSKLYAIIADYHHKFKESRMQAMHHRRMEGYALQDVFTTHVLTYAASQNVCCFTKEKATASQTPPTKQLNLTLATAPPPPAKASPPIKLPVLYERLRISSSKVRPVVSVLHDVPLDLATVQSPGVDTTPP